MRTTLVAAVAALTAVVAAPAAAQDLNGTWELAYTMETPRGSMERTLTVHLVADGSALTGTAEMAMMGSPGGGGGGGTREVEISDGTVDGAEFTFKIVLGGRRRSFEMTFSGTLDGHAMTGSVTNPMGGTSPFEGSRKGG